MKLITAGSLVLLLYGATAHASQASETSPESLAAAVAAIKSKNHEDLTSNDYRVIRTHLHTLYQELKLAEKRLAESTDRLETLHVNFSCQLREAQIALENLEKGDNKTSATTPTPTTSSTSPTQSPVIATVLAQSPATTKQYLLCTLLPGSESQPSSSEKGFTNSAF